MKHHVQDVLKDIVDWRYISWVYDDMTNRKPSDLDEILKVREAKNAKKQAFAQKNKAYNQPTVLHTQTKKNSYDRDDR